MSDDDHYAALVMQAWKRLKPKIILTNDRSIGFMPVYRTLEELRVDYPKAAFIKIKATQRKERHGGKTNKTTKTTNAA